MSCKSCKDLRPPRLPATKDAALQHALQIYIQIIYWETSNTENDPLLWTWKKSKLFTPKLTHKVGDFLYTIAWVDNNLSRVRWKCKNLSRNQCSTKICSCTKNGLSYVTACIECSRVGSYNTSEKNREAAEDIDIRIPFETSFSWLI